MSDRESYLGKENITNISKLRVFNSQIVNEISNNTTLSENSDSLISTEHAVKTFSDNLVNSISVEENVGEVYSLSILDGRVRSNGYKPDFMRADGTLAKVTTLTFSDELLLKINGVNVSYLGSNIVVSGLPVSPATTMTCLVNNVTYTGQDYTRHTREIPIDTIGANAAAFNGQLVGYTNGTETGLAILDTTVPAKLKNCIRGICLDSTGTPKSAQTLTDNAVITIHKADWIFAKNDSATVVPYSTTVAANTTPQYSAIQPTAPTLNMVWYDKVVGKYKIWNGASFIDFNAIPIGIAVMSSTACIATHSFDFEQIIKQTNTIKLKKYSNSKIITKNNAFTCAVYQKIIEFRNAYLTWDMAIHLETGYLEAANTTYFMYVTDEGRPIISPEYPRFVDELRTFRHPNYPWRCVGSSYNDSSSNLSDPHDLNGTVGGIEVFDTGGSFVWKKPVGYNKRIKVTVVGAGGSGGGSTQTELVANGTFASGASWTLDTGLTIGAGVLTISSAAIAAAAAAQNITMYAGLQYSTSFTITARTGGSVRIKLGNTVGITRASVGTFVQTLTCTNPNENVLKLEVVAAPTGVQTLSIDNVTVTITAASIGLNGGTSSFGTFVSATGGTGGNHATAVAGGTGGTGGVGISATNGFTPTNGGTGLLGSGGSGGNAGPFDTVSTVSPGLGAPASSQADGGDFGAGGAGSNSPFGGGGGAGAGAADKNIGSTTKQLSTTQTGDDFIDVNTVDVIVASQTPLLMTNVGKGARGAVVIEYID